MNDDVFVRMPTFRPADDKLNALPPQHWVACGWGQYSAEQARLGRMRLIDNVVGGQPVRLLQRRPGIMQPLQNPRANQVFGLDAFGVCVLVDLRQAVPVQ